VEQLRRIPGLTLKPVVVQGTQWDPKSPWHDVRVRKAANLALDRRTINEALTLGYSRTTGSLFPDTFQFYWAPPQPVYDPERARQLLSEAGYRSADRGTGARTHSRVRLYGAIRGTRA
jgi:peptide/nickel transport system substrate-binding protein